MKLYVTCDENIVGDKYGIYDEKMIVEFSNSIPDLDNNNINNIPDLDNIKDILGDDFYDIIEIKEIDFTDNMYHIVLIAGVWSSDNIFFELATVPAYDKKILDKVYLDINDLDESYEGERLVTLDIIDTLIETDYHHCFVVVINSEGLVDSKTIY